LSVALRSLTQAAHRRVENSGVIRRIIRRRASREAYAVYLRNLYPVYSALEKGLARHRSTAGFETLVDPGLVRCPAIESDLDALTGVGWRSRIALLPSAEAYGQRITEASQPQLVAHAYVRYLGDLYGGSILRRLLRESPGLSDEELGFYDFPAIGEVAAFRDRFKARLDDFGSLADRGLVVAEALYAFELATDLSIEIERHLQVPHAGNRQSA